MSTSNPQAKGNYIVGVNKSIVGSKVLNAAREDLGKIEDIVIDTRGNQVAYAILSFGGLLGLGEKHFAIPWESLQYDAVGHCAVLKIDKDSLKHSPGFDPDRWPDMTNAEWAQQVRSACEHRA